MEAAALPRPTLASRSLSLPAAVLRLRSDEQLVALFRGGSDEAFRVIHDRYRPRLLAYARQMLGGSQADAEDVLQDVFVRAHAALRRSDAPITLRAWLYRIAHNRCIDALRRPDPMPAEITPGTQPALARGAQHDPPIEAERSEDLRRLVRDLLDLPEQQRSALLMRELQGLSYDELACSLGVSVGAVKSLLVRARSGVLSAAVARAAPCAEICVELAETHDRGVRASGHVRRHLRECAGCRQHRADLRNQSRQFAALGPPVGLLGLLGGLGGGGGAGGGLAAAGGGGAIAACGGVAVGKVAAIAVAVALVGGAGSALTSAHHAAVPRPTAAARPHAPAQAAVVTRQRRAHLTTSIAPGAAAAPAVTLTQAATATCPVTTADPAAVAPSAAATSIPAAPGLPPAVSAPTSAAAPDSGSSAPVPLAAAACAVSPGVATTTPAVTATTQATTPAAPGDPIAATAAPGPDATATPAQTSPTATASTTPVPPIDGSGQAVGDPQPVNTGGVQAPSS